MARPAPARAPSAPAGSPGAAPSGAAGRRRAAPRTSTIKASGSQFTTTDVSGPAGKPFSLAFDNEDQGTPHNVNIKKPDGSDAFKGEIFTGVATKVYQVPALPAGTYPFVCDRPPDDDRHR